LITAPWAGFIGENSIVGAGGPIACGVALAAQAQKTGGVVIVSFGDGATSQGALHESLVFAAAYDLPVIFLCENNGWSEMTASAAIIKIDRLAKRANGYGMAGVTIDGTDPIAVRDTIAQAAERARSGGGGDAGVAAGGDDHAAGRDVVGQQPVVHAAGLEAAGDLEVLQLEPDFGAGYAEGAAGELPEGRAADEGARVVTQAGGGGLDGGLHAGVDPGSSPG
jgi:hypothetical protein